MLLDRVHPFASGAAGESESWDDSEGTASAPGEAEVIPADHDVIAAMTHRG